MFTELLLQILKRNDQFVDQDFCGRISEHHRYEVRTGLKWLITQPIAVRL
jgi:hypothetical protein